MSSSFSSNIPVGNFSRALLSCTILSTNTYTLSDTLIQALTIQIAQPGSGPERINIFLYRVLTANGSAWQTADCLRVINGATRPLRVFVQRKTSEVIEPLATVASHFTSLLSR